MYVVGLDIGYSNLKVVMGEADFRGPSRCLVTPAGAGPLRDMPERLDTESRPVDAIPVVVSGEAWVAGVEPGRLQTIDRELHKDYTSTNAFLALFHAALIQAERSVIDHLVTGLPVYQYRDAQTRERLQRALAGTHNPAAEKMVKVVKVSILPQPAGAFLDLVHEYEDIDLLEEGRVLVVDPGFFSVDWVILDGGEIRTGSSGTSLKAMSVILEKVNRLIAEDHQGWAGVDRLEKALRHGDSTVLLFGKRLDVLPYLMRAVEQVAPEALTTLRQAMRTDDRNIDIVLITGGGAGAYRQAIAEAFPKSQVVVPRDPVLSNARGFWYFGA
jgi:plasmid segregation protein ParM